MLKKPSHYESTTPRLLQEILGKMVDAVNGLEARVEHLEDFMGKFDARIEQLEKAEIAEAEVEAEPTTETQDEIDKRLQAGADEQAVRPLQVPTPEEIPMEQQDGTKPELEPEPEAKE